MTRWLGTRRAVLVIAVAPLAACYYFPSPPPDWQGDFTVENVLARAEASLVELPKDEESQGAMTEREAWTKIHNPERQAPRFMDEKDLIAAVKMARPTSGDALSMLVKWQRGGRWAAEVKGPRGPVRYVGLGATAAEIENGVLTRDDVPVDEIGVRLFLRCLFVVEFFQAGPGSEAEIIEPVELPDGRHVVNLRKFDEEGHAWVLSLDSQTARPARLRDWVVVAEGEGVPRDTYFRDFAVDRSGRLYPKVMQIYDGTMLVQETRISDLDWNQGLKDADFAVPR